ncbi:4340_t:CDS:2 [Entrophospora sp. SA101]|nr:4340_t:CDS:2 [Entrophospora sp. SA101]
MDNDNGTIVGCYGISQDPITKNYAIVMQYVPDGNLKHYLDKNSHKNLQFRILQLHYIKDGLNTVHENGLTHQDFHPGNILNHDDPNTIIWSLKICQGLRPQFQIKIPPLLENLIKRCWDANPMKRPAKVRSRKDTEFYRQYKEIEEYNQKLPEEIKFPKYKSHKGTVYTSRLLPTSEIANLLQLQEISSELKETVRGYVKAKNKSLKDQKDAQAKKNVRELEEKLEEELKKRGFATEKMDEIIRYCENYHLLELEQKQISVQGSQDQQTTNQSSTLVVELEQSSEEEIKLSFRQAEEGVEQPADNQVNTNPQQSEISNTIDTEASEQVAVVQNPPNNKEKEIKLKREDFQGKLVAEDYPNLEKLYLRDIKNIDKITLRNLPQLQECTI